MNQKHNEHIITKLNNPEYSMLITILDYRVMVSQLIKNLTIENPTSQKVLVDALICSGFGKYRFIALNTNGGKIQLKPVEYVNPAEDLIELADNIIRNDPLALTNSVLPESARKKFKEGKIK